MHWPDVGQLLAVTYRDSCAHRVEGVKAAGPAVAQGPMTDVQWREGSASSSTTDVLATKILIRPPQCLDLWA